MKRVKAGLDDVHGGPLTGGGMSLIQRTPYVSIWPVTEKILLPDFLFLLFFPGGDVAFNG